MAHKYLREVMDRKPFFYKFPWKWKFLKQRARCGFDKRETYDLNYTFYCWLYERVNMYIDEASGKVDLHYHRVIWKGVEYTHFELIQELLIRLKFYFKSQQDFLVLSPKEETLVKEIGEIWAVLLPEMWW